MPFERRKVGQPFNPSATEHNAFIAAALAHRNNAQNVSPGGSAASHGERITVHVQNKSGADAGRFDVMQIKPGMAIEPEQPAAAQNAALNAPVLLADSAADSAFAMPAVLLEPIKDDGIGLAVIAGITPALVDVEADSHDFAELGDGNRFRTIPGPGSVRVLWKPSGVADDRLAFVHLGSERAHTRMMFKTPVGGIAAPTGTDPSDVLPVAECDAYLVTKNASGDVIRIAVTDADGASVTYEIANALSAAIPGEKWIGASAFAGGVLLADWLDCADV